MRPLVGTILALAMGCSGNTTVAVQIVSTAPVVTLTLAARLDGGHAPLMRSWTPVASALQLPATLVLVLPDYSARVFVSVDAISATGAAMHAEQAVVSVPHSHQSLWLQLSPAQSDGGSDLSSVVGDLAAVDLSSCTAGQIVCGGTCINPSSNTQHCGASSDCNGANSGAVCGAMAPICNNGHCAPAVCAVGTDPTASSSNWVVCGLDGKGVWMSHNGSGSSWHIDAICKAIGYSHADAFGGNCGSICGYCDGTHSCTQPGAKGVFDGNAQTSNGPTCGTSDANGFIVCGLPTWHCS